MYHSGLSCELLWSVCVRVRAGVHCAVTLFLLVNKARTPSWKWVKALTLVVEVFWRVTDGVRWTLGLAAYCGWMKWKSNCAILWWSVQLRTYSLFRVQVTNLSLIRTMQGIHWVLQRCVWVLTWVLEVTVPTQYTDCKCLRQNRPRSRCVWQKPSQVAQSKPGGQEVKGKAERVQATSKIKVPVQIKPSACDFLTAPRVTWDCATNIKKHEKHEMQLHKQALCVFLSYCAHFHLDMFISGLELLLIYVTPLWTHTSTLKGLGAAILVLARVQLLWLHVHTEEEWGVFVLWASPVGCRTAASVHPLSKRSCFSSRPPPLI